ncbi:fibronectin type III domain-containing protein [Granulicella sp. dw_53]|uniref:fibronectin type III domain-containing protein n=1 Tax=Granulicella sp. dw_53 TaxID=2719792 RepID=UPI001BD5BFD8|nr:fibronectin type III domain-containing protein [Granulicella sp. dw_53]
MLPLRSSSSYRSAVTSLPALGVRLLFASAAILIATGCASPGPPRPPSLNLPQPATDLTAERIGDQVILHWTTPTKTTDKLPLKGNFTARICRDAVAATTPATPTTLASTKPSTPPCTSVLRVAAHTGQDTATDTLPSSLTADPSSLLSYRVEIENAAGHTAGPSSEAFVAAGSAPPPVTSLRATAVPTGARLEWQPHVATSASSPTFIELRRLSPELAARQTASKSKSSQSPQLAKQESAEVHLRAGSGPSPAPGDGAPATQSQPETAPEPAGTIDQTAHLGETYRYTAQRVRIVHLKSRTLEIRSVPSSFISIALRDTFPPAVPTELAAILGEPSTGPTRSSSIDLSWQPNSEPDLAGYLVYRRTLSNTSTPASRLTATPLSGPSFRDLTAVPGQRYAYTVTAVDTSGNESAPSTPIEETLPQP